MTPLPVTSPQPFDFKSKSTLLRRRLIYSSNCPFCRIQENEDSKSLAGHTACTARRRLAGSRRIRRRAQSCGMSRHVQLRSTPGNSPAPIFHPCFCTRHARQYELNSEVVIWMNTVGPLSNRQETYEYYQLPYCHGNAPVEHHHETLGEALQGMDLINSGIPMKFRSKQNRILENKAAHVPPPSRGYI